MKDNSTETTDAQEITITSAEMIRKALEEIKLYTELIRCMSKDTTIEIETVQMIGSKIASARSSIEYNLNNIEAQG